MNYPTGSDLNDESIIGPLGARRAPDMAPVAVMASCEPDMKQMRSAVDNDRAVPFFNSTLIRSIGQDRGGFCVVGPFIGAPYSVMLLESLIARGARKILVMGWCGAVTERLKVGDILLPCKAIVDEGTSKHYKPLDDTLPVSIPDLKLVEKLSAYLTSCKVAHEKTTVWTTDAIYRETHKKISYFRSLGADAVEMELSALFSVAEYRKVSIAGLLVVSDSVASKNWDPGFRNRQFKESRKNSCEAIMGFSKRLSYEND